MRNEEIGELADAIHVISERVSDLAYDAVREQIKGSDEHKALERQLQSARRSLVKAESLLRALGNQ